MTTRQSPAVAPVRRALRCALFILLSTSPLLSVAADAEDDLAARAYAQQKAALEFKLLVMDAGRRNAPEALQSEQAQALVRTIADQRRLLDEQQFRAEDIPRLQDICTNAIDAGMSVMLFGIDSATPRDLQDPTYLKTVARPVYENMKRNEAQLVLLMPFMMRCMAPMMRLVSDHFQTVNAGDLTPAQQAGLQQARNGILQTLDSGMQSIDETVEMPVLRNALVGSVRDTAREYARVLRLDQRPPIAARIRASAGRADKEHRESLEVAASAFDDTRCEGMCLH